MDIDTVPDGHRGGSDPTGSGVGPAYRLQGGASSDQDTDTDTDTISDSDSDAADSHRGPSEDVIASTSPATHDSDGLPSSRGEGRPARGPGGSPHRRASALRLQSSADEDR